MAQFHLTAPVSREQLEPLRIGDQVTISGPAFTCRSKFQRAVFDEQLPMPSVLKPCDVLIHAGPIVLSEPAGYRLVSFMPTSSKRFEKWGAQSVRDWGLHVIIGKTTMGPDTMAAMCRLGCIHLTPVWSAPTCGATPSASLASPCWTRWVRSRRPGSWNSTGSALCVVDIDTAGNNLFDELDQAIEANRLLAYRKLNIPDDFKPTKLWG
jgi:L(+)-tartrate dehydratase beta subunit